MKLNTSSSLGLMKLIETDSCAETYHLPASHHISSSEVTPDWEDCRAAWIKTERQEDALPIEAGDFGKIHEKYRKTSAFM